MQTHTAYPKDKEQEKAIKLILKALQIPFEVTPKVEPSYNPEFAAKILQGDEDIKPGRYKSIKIEDIWK